MDIILENKLQEAAPENGFKCYEIVGHRVTMDFDSTDEFNEFLNKLLDEGRL